MEEVELFDDAEFQPTVMKNVSWTEDKLAAAFDGLCKRKPDERVTAIREAFREQGWEDEANLVSKERLRQAENHWRKDKDGWNRILLAREAAKASKPAAAKAQVKRAMDQAKRVEGKGNLAKEISIGSFRWCCGRLRACRATEVGEVQELMASQYRGAGAPGAALNARGAPQFPSAAAMASVPGAIPSQLNVDPEYTIELMAGGNPLASTLLHVGIFPAPVLVPNATGIAAISVNDAEAFDDISIVRDHSNHHVANISIITNLPPMNILLDSAGRAELLDLCGKTHTDADNIIASFDKLSYEKEVVLIRVRFSEEIQGTQEWKTLRTSVGMLTLIPFVVRGGANKPVTMSSLKKARKGTATEDTSVTAAPK